MNILVVQKRRKNAALNIWALMFFLTAPFILRAQTLGPLSHYSAGKSTLLLVSQNGEQVRISAYANEVVRIQFARAGQPFLPDNRYEMVTDHSLKGSLYVINKRDRLEVQFGSHSDLRVTINKKPLLLTFGTRSGQTLLSERTGVRWKNNSITTDFIADSNEHFCGLGHQAYGLVPSLDLKGQRTGTNYGNYDFKQPGENWLPQGFLVVPFYLSGKGYGIFLNSTFPNQFCFGKDGAYYMQIDTKGFEGQLDYFFFKGSFRAILNQYTALTGRPVLPQRSFFGLQLSDKDSPGHNGEQWWKEQVSRHRMAGLPLDHIINDNRWRAGTGAWSGSWFEWDHTRFPKPADFAHWLKQQGLTCTLDFNRNNAPLCWGWKPSFNIPDAGCVKEPEAVPDYTSPDVRHWLWSLFWRQSFNPALKFPGDGLWIDETDELQCIPDTVHLANGRSWAENRNYYSFLVTKAIVQEGWDNMNNGRGIGPVKRPYVWLRGSTAGAQRYGIHWTGDLAADYDWMKKTIRGMQASGLSGFPYFNHDAGGFRQPGPDDTMYVKWAMAFGSFAPIWRPHGVSGSPRWPMNRSIACQQAAAKYGKLRYELMPYIYTNAYNAAAKGLPMARAMVIDYRLKEEAWKYDLQYMWGDFFLVAPQTSGYDSSYRIWLPRGKWYCFWNDSILNGDRVIKYSPKWDELPLFVKAGAIIPEYNYAQSTAWIDPHNLTLEIYPGNDGFFGLCEDDGVSEYYRTKNQKRFTSISYGETKQTLHVAPAVGTYKGAPSFRNYTLVWHAVNKPRSVTINGIKTEVLAQKNAIGKQNIFFNKKEQKLYIFIKNYKVLNKLIVSITH